MMKRYMVSITEEMVKKLEEERRKRLLDSIPETIRTILSEYLSRS
jgi:metal-responsive CopG/Arc/MetJ family transcriptional regulator